jgi:hypothetical protein
MHQYAPVCHTIICGREITKLRHTGMHQYAPVCHTIICGAVCFITYRGISGGSIIIVRKGCHESSLQSFIKGLLLK